MPLHNLVFDPIPFKGGSKIATSEALSLCSPETTRFTIVTVDKNFWQRSELAAKHEVQIITMASIPWLSRQSNGLYYWLNQLCVAMMLLICLVRTHHVHRFIAASGPGIDMALYLINLLFKRPIIQFIHGNVATSGAIGWCLTQANKVFYLPSSKASLKGALNRYFARQISSENSETLTSHYLKNAKFRPFVNGLASNHWPSRARIGSKRCFWAASLLKWKGLDLFKDALRSANQELPIATTICYIKPKNIDLNSSKAPDPILWTDWFHDPSNLDQLRQRCGIFVSTSTNEPFGLSILEALAAGQCVVIPKDESYWDQQLTDGKNCIKYTAGDAKDLAAKLIRLQLKPDMLDSIQPQAFQLAKNYQAADCYREIVTAVTEQDALTLNASSILAKEDK